MSITVIKVFIVHSTTQCWSTVVFRKTFIVRSIAVVTFSCQCPKNSDFAIIIIDFCTDTQYAVERQLSELINTRDGSDK